MADSRPMASDPALLDSSAAPMAGVASCRDKIGPGALVLVVGPSGAGKDTLLRLAKDAMATDACVTFPHRIITRGPDANEDHQPIDETGFAALVEAGGTALWWRAHGLGYALPAEVDAHIKAGGVVVANVSRRVIPDAVQRYARVKVIYITAPIDVLASRLASRGREDPGEVAERLRRSVTLPPDLPDLVTVQNVGNPMDGASAIVAVVRGLVGGSGVA
jgi:ribose 1,5-bisphosphokinase